MKRLALLFFLGVLAGGVVMVGTLLFIGGSAKHLPGGSMAAGVCLGLVFPYRKGVARWWLLVIGACAGCIGWLLVLHFLP